MKNKNVPAKKYVLILLACLAAGVLAYNTIQKTISHVIGITSQIPDDMAGFENFEARLKLHLQRIQDPHYTFEEMKQDEMERLQYEVKYAEVVHKILDKLRKYHQLGS